MNWKQNKGFIVGAGVLGALLAVCAVLAFFTDSAKTRVQEELNAKVSERDALTGAKMYPSLENVRKLSAENKVLSTFLDTLVDDIRTHQPNPPPITSPGDFNLKLEAEQKTLLALAAATKVSLPILEGEVPQIVPVSLGPKFWLDFNEYGEGGKLPEPAAIPLLAAQLQVLAEVCSGLVKSGISEINEVQRQRVETPVVVPESSEEGRKPVAVANEPALTNFTCSVTYTAPEDAVWVALNSIVNHHLPIVVTGVEIHNLSAHLQPAFTGAGTAASGSSSLAEQLQAISGPKGDSKKLETAGTEQVRVKVQFSVYRVNSPQTVPSTQPPQGR